MKFGKFLARNLIPEWREYYFPYKRFKQYTREKMLRDSDVCTLLNAEVVRINDFHTERVQQLALMYDELEHAVTIQCDDSCQRTPYTVKAVQRRVLELQTLMSQLRDYSMMNNTAFHKIIKKCNKKIFNKGSKLLEAYAKQMQKEPFNGNVAFDDLLLKTENLLLECDRLITLELNKNKPKGRKTFMGKECGWRDVMFSFVWVFASITAVLCTFFCFYYIGENAWVKANEGLLWAIVLFLNYVAFKSLLQRDSIRNSASYLRSTVYAGVWCSDMVFYAMLGTCPFGTNPLYNTGPVYQVIVGRSLRLLPTNVLSRLWGLVHAIPLPRCMRKPMYMMWAVAFNCNLHEMRYPLESYSCLNEFFSRPLKEGARLIHHKGMVSPVDGRVVICGEVVGDTLEQVKGLSYSLSSFLGLDNNDVSEDEEEEDFSQNETAIQVDQLDEINQNDVVLKHSNSTGNGHIFRKRAPKKGRKLYHCVLYLAPGDYHRIHAPTDMKIYQRKHFPGSLLPVGPLAVKMVKGLFSINERVVLSGTWENEADEDLYFSLTAVGAYNVGSIALNFDKELATNKRWGAVTSLSRKITAKRKASKLKSESYGNLMALDSPTSDKRNLFGFGLRKNMSTDSLQNMDYEKINPLIQRKDSERKLNNADGVRVNVYKSMEMHERRRTYPNGICIPRGEEIGYFKLGSTVVLIFETKSDFKFQVSPGDKVQVGQLIGSNKDEIPDITEDIMEQQIELAIEEQIEHDQDINSSSNNDSYDDIKMKVVGTKPVVV